MDGTTWMTVVGVVGDVRYSGLAAPPAPAMYYAFAQQPFQGMFLFVRTDGDPLAHLPTVQRAVLEIDAELPLARAGSLEDGVAASVAGQRLNTRLLGGFAALAALLAALGVYGVVAHAVAQREREMGVRMALGARPGDVVRLAVGRGLRPVAIGIAIGVVLATVATRLLASALYETSRLDPATYGAAALGFGIVAALAAWIPSRRAARADPVAVLRGE
jgi:putative ABC transport system permease protein